MVSKQREWVLQVVKSVSLLLVRHCQDTCRASGKSWEDMVDEVRFLVKPGIASVYNKVVRQRENVLSVS